MKKLFFYLLSVLSVAGVVLVFPLTLNAQISPGDLTNAHAHLEGMSNCTQCHVLGDKVENSKCLECHKELKARIDANAGYHSGVDVKGKECIVCHSEHHGRDFEIVVLDEKKFDHPKTGFELTGKHNTTACKDCHQAKYIASDDIKKLKRTYLGLSEQCLSCHEDVHQKTLGNDCATCHNTTAFKPAEKFNHDKAKFKLADKHLKVACEKCHTKETKNEKPFQNFTGLNFKNCTPCHEDVHKGKYGVQCERCHNINSFKEIKRGLFNHDSTEYPLVGKHRDVACKDCHKQGVKVRISFGKCTDCHSDYHKGDFVTNGKVRNCEECHNVQGFTPSLFTIEKHSKLKFALTGGHLSLPCQTCHHKEKNWHFRIDGKKCTICHENTHGKELTAKYLGDNECERCHSADNWKTITFDHAKTDFALQGKHLSTQCVDCHVDKKGQIIAENIDSLKNHSKKIWLFASTRSNCESCHNDVHKGQFKEGGQTLCERCHAFENWTAPKFNHEKTKFSLKGGHEKVKCFECHKPIVIIGEKYVKYIIEDFRCSTCHS